MKFEGKGILKKDTFLFFVGPLDKIYWQFLQRGVEFETEFQIYENEVWIWPSQKAIRRGNGA